MEWQWRHEWNEIHWYSKWNACGARLFVNPKLYFGRLWILLLRPSRVYFIYAYLSLTLSDLLIPLCFHHVPSDYVSFHCIYHICYHIILYCSILHGIPTYVILPNPNVSSLLYPMYLIYFVLFPFYSLYHLILCI